MTTVGKALEEAIRSLAEAGVDGPRYDAQLLLAWTLKCRREDLAREPEGAIGDRDLLVFRKAVELRALRRPLPYITGEQYFYGRPFKINRAVLIPRPETELLVQTALEKLQDIPNPAIADIGTGSGCIAVTLGCERTDARLWATDISGDALKLARKNVARYKLADRLTLLHGSLVTPLPQDIPYDLIVSNPPYVTEAEYPTLQPEVRDYEPSLALTGEPGAAGPDGTAIHRALIEQARSYLKPGGWLMMELGIGQAEIVGEAARTAGYADVDVRNDLAEIGRIVVGRKPN